MGCKRHGATSEKFVSQATVIKGAAEKVMLERKVDVHYEIIGTMIEVPRAALISDQLASVDDPEDGKPLCSFFSFGTNDFNPNDNGHLS